MTARRFADGLRRRGHAVKIAAVGADGENDCALEEKYLPVISEVSAKNQIKFAKFERDKVARAFEGADLVHFIFPFGFEKKCKKLADEMGIPTTAAFHVQPENISYNVRLGKIGIVNRLIYFYLRRTFYSRFNRIHCPSAFIADSLRRHGYGGQMYVISNGYDEAFKPAEEPVRNDKFEIVMVGRLSPEKNQKTLISAIAASAHREEIRLTLLGNGSCAARLKRQAARQGVQTEFGFLPKKQLVEKLQSSDQIGRAHV